jgi:EmrB/QacA subfamily drug resistance transporter
VSSGSGGSKIDAALWRVAIVVILGSMMTTLDATIVNVALESLSRDLKSSLDSIQWVVTGYLLALAAVIPVSGWTARRFGAKRVYLIALAVFTVGSALSGLATSAPELIGFRFLQGLGGGMILPVGQMILVKKSGPLKLAKMMSVIGVPSVMMPVIGPTIGGLLIDSASWRWIFYLNLPIGVVAVIAAVRLLPSDEPEIAGRLDVAGLGLVAAGLVSITYGLAEIGATNTVTSVKVVAPLLCGLGLVGAFVVRSLRVPRPLLDVRLYANRAFRASSLTVFCLGASMFGGMILMPLYFQVVRHEDPLVTGLLLMPMGGGAAISIGLSGRLTDRFGAGVTAMGASAVTLVATVPFVLISGQTSFVLLGVAMGFRGFGLGLSNMPSMTAAYRALKPSQVSDASPQLTVLQRIGGSIGTAVFAIVLQHNLTQAGASVSAQGSAFGSTFIWVIVVTAFAAAPTILLSKIERQAKAIAVEAPSSATVALEPGLS